MFKLKLLNHVDPEIEINSTTAGKSLANDSDGARRFFTVYGKTGILSCLPDRGCFIEGVVTFGIGCGNLENGAVAGYEGWL